MNRLTDLNYLKTFLKQSGLKPRHYLGQNFLVDEEVLGEILDAAELTKSDTVLEVGPGIGTLTVELVKRAGKVIAVEKDERMMGLLSRNAELVSASQKRDPEFNLGLRIVNQDILKFHLDKYVSGPYKVVANIPYYLTSHLIQYFLNQKNQPKLLVLMVQKEVAERVVAKPGELSILGISVQFFADAEIAAVVPKESFWPVPKVDSAILRIEPKDKYPEITDYKLFFSTVKKAFAGKRKQLKNTLGNIQVLRQAGIDPMARPQDLSIDDWIRLYLEIRN
ncbi:MAG: ribosomal RNA small subunit methyltransferase A, partial [Candidatus Doudnabacteria bacterium]|nr:ribosomal RNA small subunit methyltransferase A [Candidatus Doudnabacteria bacterium]